MSFKENLNRICRERGTTLTALVKSLHLSTSKVSRWNEGSLPKEDTMLLLARTLDCSVMDFFADEEDLAPVQPMDEDEVDMLRVYRSLSRRAKHEFMSVVYNFDSNENKANSMNESVEDTVTLYRAAKSESNTEHEIITETKERIKRLKQLPKVTSDNDL